MDLKDPETLGFDAARLARIDAFLRDRYLDSKLLPNAQILVARDGEPVHFSSLGSAREDGTPLATDAVFRIASMTKPIVSLAYMMLVEEGVTALEDPVEKVVPEFRGLGVYAGGGGDWGFLPTVPCRPMRMIDLLRQTSGLTYGFQNRTSVDLAYRTGKLDDFTAIQDNDAFVAGLASVPLEFEPGTAWNYSVSSDVLGVVIARLCKADLGTVLRDRIFGPLGMKDTGFHLPEAERGRLTDAWMRKVDGSLVPIDHGADSLLCSPPRFQGGGGGLVSTTADYHRFCAMLVHGGELDGVRLVSPATLALMMANHLPGRKDLTQMSRSLFSEAANAGSGFGLGFAVTIDPVASLVPGSVGMCFWGGIYSTAFFVDLREGVSMVFMTQLYPSCADPIRRELQTLIYSALTRLRH